MTQTSYDVGVLIVPGFSMMSFAAIVEPLRAANRLTQRRLYSWPLLSAHGGVVEASNGIGVVTEAPVSDLRSLDMLLICAGSGGQRFRHAPSLQALKAYRAAGTLLGGVSSGPHILARAGLLAGHRCTLHWEDMPAFREEFPGLDLSSSLYEIDRGRYTCAGGIAGMDMMLDVIAQQHGEELAAKVADQFIRSRRRLSAHQQQSAVHELLAARSSRLTAAIALMESHIEDPLSITQIAETLGVTPRHLSRLFVSQLHATPAGHYMEMRLQHARTLLENTSLSIAQVAQASGFGSAQLLARHFGRRFQMAPTLWRQERNPLRREV